MRKYTVIALAALMIAGVLSFTKTTAPAEAAPAEKEMATVYIYRVGQFGAAAANWSIWADETKICKLSNNKFIAHQVKPGKHVYSARVGGVGILKKETEIELETEAGGTYYIACNVKTSFTRARLELIEVTKSTATKQMAKMSLDNCQEKIDEE